MSKTMASVIANYMEHEGDRYDIGNSASNKVLGMDLQAALSAAGFGLVADAKAEAWDHGHHDGAVDQMLHMENDGAKTTPNPYRDPS